MAGQRRFTLWPIFTVVVNNAELVKINAARLETDALRILRQVPGVTVVEEEPRAGDHDADAILHFAGRDAPVGVEVKRRANAATAWQLVQQAKARPNLALLLIAEETTAEAREILERRGIGVVDGFGNAHIEIPGLLFHLEGRGRPRRAGAAPARLQGKAGVIAQAVLLTPDRDWRVQELAHEADVSPGLAHRVLARLEREGLITSRGAGPRRVRRLADRAALLDLWAEENIDRPHRTLGFVLGRAPGLVRKISSALDSRGLHHAMTGAGAASLVATFVTAVPVVHVWLSARVAPDEALVAAGGEPVANGENVVLLQAPDDSPLAFRTKSDDTWLANRFRLYVDLRADPRRSREQAEHLRQEVIGF